MRNNVKNLPIGKISHKLLGKMLKDFTSGLSNNDKRVIMGSKIGEDAAVIDMGDKYLIAKTDPITFATNEIGYYVVIINVNDVVSMGATPKWFQSTILLPEKRTDPDLIESIFKSIYNTCKSMGITVIGGHTEIAIGLQRPLVVGSLLGEVEKEKLVLTSGAEPNDALILTKGIFIEGTSIIGREKEKFLLKMNYSKDFIERCRNYLYNPGITVYKEAFLANQYFQIKSMHDPTEGGLACGIAEMTIASDTGVKIEKTKINILPEPLELSKIFGINPMNTISSGSLLIALSDENSSELIELLKKNNISSDKIGYFVSKKKGLRIQEEDGKINPFHYTETDEITKIFNRG
jgi:hydrogenase expression/formation protein HypE